ncbi:MAG: sigma-70 family RNA polymerase sigma factor [Planctomycetes bacterium]|nr:sigma-70 family RNA polymerase sigma factor [Planctomycetota bacterium]
MPRSVGSLTRMLPAVAPAPADAPLLRAFHATRSDGAFTELVRRHGPMVLGVCRRVLGNAADADDAFQAVFLVLARKAGAVRENLAGWLHAVAVRTARGMRVTRERRRKYEGRANARCEPAAAPESDHDTAAAIDEELARLPDHYRLALVLCELRGLSRKRAAAELGVPEGTLSSRLAAAKRKLAALLSARGLAPAGPAAALVPATVSAALVEAVRAAVGGAARSVASAAASTVVRAMLYDQLKAAALAAGVLLTVVCGGLAMTGAPDGSDPSRASVPAPVPRPTEAEKWVDQLGADSFVDREDAARRLRALGLKAESALRAGLRSDSPEVRARSAELLREVRAAACEALAKDFDPAGTDDYDHPVWRRFRSVVGDDASARRLFARMIADPHRLRLLDAAEREPEKAGELYEREVKRLADNTRAGLERLSRPSPFDVDGTLPATPAQLRGNFAGLPFLNTDDPTPTPADVAVGFYLGTYPATAKAFPESNWAAAAPYGGGDQHWGLFHNAFQKGVEVPFPNAAGNPIGSAYRRLVAAWLARRANPGSICLGLEQARAQKIAEVLPTARAAAGAGQPVKVRAATVPILGAFGRAEDEPLVAALLDDRTPYTGTKYGTEQRDATAQVRDMALATLLVMRGRDPFDFGFPGCGPNRGCQFHEIPLYSHDLGFHDDPSREAAHKRARAWLDERPRSEEPKPDPVARLIEQLGAAEFADREAARAELLEIGEPALKALRAAAAAHASAEVRARAAELVTVIGSPTYGLVRTFAGHTDVVGAVAFFPAGDKIVTSGFDATYRTWDVKTGKELGRRSIGQPDARTGGPVAVSPDGKRLATLYFVSEVGTGKLLFDLDGHVADLTRVRYDRDGKRILSASYDGTIRVWDADGKRVRAIESHMGRQAPAGLQNGFGPPPGPGGGPAVPRIERRGVRDAVFSPDGKRIVSGGTDGTVRMWDTDTGKELWGWKQSRDVLAVAFLPDGKRAVSGDAEGTIRVWDAETGKELKQLTGHIGGVDALAVGPNGRLVSAGADKTVRVWDAEAGKELRCFRGHTAAVRTVAVSPDGKTVLSGGEDNAARLWAMPAGGR